MKRILLFALLSIPIISEAQTLCTISGAQVYAGPGLEIRVNGGLQIDSSSVFQNYSSLIISGDFTNCAQFDHFGSVYLQGDWENNGQVNSASLSVVQLDGGIQKIKGDSVTTFGILSLLGSGDKRLEQHAKADVLQLNDRILITDSLSLSVLNSQPTAIERTSGFVLSERYGVLNRNVTSGQAYLFPVGRNLDYRPVTLTPTLSTGVLGVRFANADASQEGLARTQVDTNICRSNEHYYHLIEGTIGQGTQCSFVVDSSAAVDFPFVALRNPLIADVWHLVANGNAVFNGSTASVNVVIPSNSSNRAILLVRKRPARPEIVGDTAFCQESSDAVFHASYSSGLETNWTIASGSIEQQTDSSVSVNWDNSASGLVSAFQTDNAGCSSFPSSLPIVLWPKPIAELGISAPEFPYEDQVFVFTSLSSGSISQSWTIENNGFYSDSILKHAFHEPGIYPILLTVVNSFGCIDTASASVEVIEGMQFPNTFSPNGDGVNDELFLMNSGIQEYGLQIFDRWGTLIFETQSSKLSWDGKTSSGEKAPAGTYFLVLSAKTSKTVYEKRTTITLFD